MSLDFVGGEIQGGSRKIGGNHQLLGCGKTTLMNIMLGLLEHSRGEVLINDRNLKTIAAGDYAS